MKFNDDSGFIIRMFHVYKRYASKNALIDINLDISENEFLFITGPTGAGKTTLLKLLYLGEPASEGQILVGGRSLSRISRRQIPFLRRKFGVIFQNYKLIPTKNIFDNIALVAEAVGTKKRLIQKKVKSVLRAVGMEEKLKAFPPGLSGGEQQRVAVARAIAGNPGIILADEPTGSLDAESARIIFDLLKGLHTRGATVIIATHDTELIRRTGGRVVLLEQGRLKMSTIIPKLS
ncbi:cell division ATP-binding protein FtsE [Desulfonema magnum]|uniref:Cell division ATP-binding protein FtsE n=1 Tax=Desulfonema magnum TaxID=45655 RepID=A0A975GTF7_9BACT|nr:ATP-binding cassette domain-containing protein [Desulfonema magnum]QTA92937.1 Putve cell division ATP-binding protein, FtsE-like [Desulfonema magnum]